jgi:hypothetical protein
MGHGREQLFPDASAGVEDHQVDVVAGRGVDKFSVGQSSGYAEVVAHPYLGVSPEATPAKRRTSLAPS